MDDESEVKDEKPFHVDRAKTGRAACKKCKQKIAQGELRMGKLGFNPFSSGTMKYWHHVACMFEVFSKQRKTTKRIESFSEVDGWDKLTEEDKSSIKEHFSKDELERIESNFNAESNAPQEQGTSRELESDNKDNTFRAFRKICSELTNASSYLAKTAIVKDFFEKGSNGKSFTGDIQLWCKSLLPMAAKKVYNLQSKQLVKIFSDIFRTDKDAMLEDLEQGDVAETIGNFFEKSNKVGPAKKAVLMLQDVDVFLDYLSKLTRETDQIDHFKSILPKCTTNDLKIIIRLIKHDLRINAGPKHILEALDPNAYAAFQASRDLEKVVADSVKSKTKGNSSSSKNASGIKVGINIMTPVLPMLAEACSSIEMAFKKCPNGMYSELKYDGERVQLHKHGDIFKYFSRSLKPVLEHKVRHFEKYIPEAFPHGKDLIIDSEILMVDTKTSKPLPFGTLGAHKKTEFKDACVCLFVFDCIYYNGESLIDRSMKERRQILHDNMKEIEHRVMFSESEEIYDREDLEAMMVKVFRGGEEGLILKPILSKYEPGKRHWLKVKKDYLAGGSMADSADLVVLGAWFGTGKKGGIMSVFLMGCFDEKRRRWVTVTKVHGGHDDRTLESLQTELKMEKISRDASRTPEWLYCAKTMVPDFVAADPKESQVWEITGAEFTCNQVHTADGISIRFPRVTRIRHDKTWETANSLSELKQIYNNSKDTSNFTLKKLPSTLQSEKLDSSPGKSSLKKTSRESSSTVDKGIKNNESVDRNDRKDKKRRRSKESLDNESRKKISKEDIPKHFSTSSENESKAHDKKKEGIDRDCKGRKVEHRSNSKYNGSNILEVESESKSPQRSKHKVKEQSGSSDLDQSTAKSPGTSNEEDERRKSRDKSRENSYHSSNKKPKSPGSDHNSCSSSRKRSYEERSPGVQKQKEVQKRARKLFSDTSSGSETEIDDDPVPTAHVAIAMKNTLPEVFNDHVILFHNKVGDTPLLRRFVIAYGGHVFDSSSNNCLQNGKRQPTHVVYPSRDIEMPLHNEKAVHVSVDWLWDSIKQQKVSDVRNFEVTFTMDEETE